MPLLGGNQPPRKRRSGRSKGRKPASSPPSPSPSPRSYRRGLNLVGRLLAWYTLYTVLFRCPTSLLSSSPVVCHGYHSVHNFLTPHLQPYYDSYAADYVTTFTPYVSHTNEAYIYPFLDKASVGYEKYAQPAIAKAKLIAEHQYQRNLHPHVSKALAQLNATYEQYLAAYFNTVHRLYTNLATSPFWTKTRAYVDGFYRRYLLPGYERVSPYLNKAKEKGKHVVVVYLSPYVKEGARVSGVWFEKNVGSGIRGIWKEYVQVQMRRIRDRLKTGGHTGNGFEHSSHSSHGSSDSAPTDPVPGEAAESSHEDESLEQQAVREAARKQIEDDLATYTEKFEKHAVEAIESLNMHVDEIATVAMELKKPEVESQLTRLDQLIGNELQDLKATIINLAKSHQPGVTEEEKQKNKLETFDQLFMATKKVTTLVKEAVQNMRWDSQRFLASVYDEVAAAADTHIEKVDNLIDSGIQELGMKWAWQNDGVTYKDWARYQELKKEFSGIRAKVIKAAERNQRLQEVTNWAEGDSWEAGAYNMAKAATAELARLKRVGKKKIERNDYSGDFSDICLTQQASEEDTPVMGLQENVEAVVGEANSGGIPQEVLQEVDQGVDSEMVQEGVLEAKSDAVEGDTQFESGKTEGTAEAVVPAQSEQEQVPIHQEAAEPIALVPIEEADVQLPDEAAAEPFHFRPSEGAYVHHPEGAAEPIAPVPAEEAYVQPLEGAAEDVTSVPTAEEHSSQEVGEAEASAIPGTDKAASSTQVAEPLPIPLPEVEEIVNWANEELSRIMDNALPLISSHEPGVLEDAIQKSAKVTELAFEAISLAIYGTDEAKPTNTPSGNDEAVSSGNKNAEYVAERRYLNQMRRAAEAILKQNVEYAYQLLVLTHEETKYAMPAEVPDAAEGAKDVAGLGDNMVTEETKASNGDIKDEL